MNQQTQLIFAFSVAFLTACNVNLNNSPIGAAPPQPQKSAPAPDLVSPQGSPLQTGPGSRNHSPIIQQIIVNPSSIAGPDDILTLKALANDADGDGLRLTWQTTKGLLSSDQGELVTWKPKRPDGSVASGVATVSVLASDNSGGTASASINITIGANGSASLIPSGGGETSASGEAETSNLPLPAPPPIFVEEGP